MIGTIRKYWHLFWYIRKMELIRLIEYRSDFFLWFFISTMWTIFNFLFISLLFDVSQSIAGWTKSELYVLLSVYTMLDAFTWSIFYPNMIAYTDRVFTGELAQLLIKPVNTIFMVTSSNSNIHNAPRFIIGFGMLWYSLNNVAYEISALRYLGFFLIFCTSLALIYTLWFLMATVSFWVERLTNINDIIPAFRRIYQFPKDIYTGVFSFIFTFVLPFGLISTVPATVLIRRTDQYLILYMIFFTIFLIFLANRFFQISIRRFVSHGG